MTGLTEAVRACFRTVSSMELDYSRRAIEPRMIVLTLGEAREAGCALKLANEGSIQKVSPFQTNERLLVTFLVSFISSLGGSGLVLGLHQPPHHG